MKTNQTQFLTGIKRTRTGFRAGLLLTFFIHLAIADIASAAQDTTTGYLYDAGGNLRQIVSPLDTQANPVKTDYLHDSLDRNYQINQPPPAPGQSALAPVTNLEYDGLDQLSRIVDPRGLDTLYNVSGIGNLISLDSPDTGLTDYSLYDEAGNLKTRVDARGFTTHYGYDGLGRLTVIDYATGTDTVFTYDGGPANTNPINIGKLTQINDESGVTVLGYDALGRLNKKTQKISGGQTSFWQTVVYAYGTSGFTKGKLQRITYPSGMRVNYGYNAAGQIASISYNPVKSNGVGYEPTATTLLSNITYTPSGRFRWGRFGNHSTSTPNVINHVDDLDGRIKSYTLGNPNQGGLTRSLAFDPDSRVTDTLHTGTGTGAFAPANFNQSYGYDNLGRLTSYTAANSTQSYGYDMSGNRIAFNGSGQIIDNLSNRLLQTSLTSPLRQHDNAGNLSNDGTISFTHNARGRLSSVKIGTTVTKYYHNGLEQRVKKVGSAITSTNQYVYDESGHLLGEYDFYGRPLQETVYLGDMPVAVIKQTISAGTTGIILTDNSNTANTIVQGSWTTVANTGAQGGSHQTHVAVAGTSTDKFTWKLNLPGAGKYFIQARWSANNTRANNAAYNFNGSGGNSYRSINQKANGNTWVNLGLKTISGASTISVTLKPSSTGTVSADAVRAVPAQAASNVYYVYTDHLYTPRVITKAIDNTTGNPDNRMVWRWDHADPFGASQPKQNPAGLGSFTYNPRFPGQLYDSETGLICNYHRTYDPKTGTYVQSDPIGLSGGINTYSYVGGNPVNNIDPLGLNPGNYPDDGTCGFLCWFNGIYNPDRPPVYSTQPLPKRSPAEKAEMDAEHKAYDAVCNNPPKKTEPEDKCTDLLNRINYHKTCANMKEQWDKKWTHPDFPGGRHADEIAKRRAAAEKLQEIYDKECGKNCP